MQDSISANERNRFAAIISPSVITANAGVERRFLSAKPDECKRGNDEWKKRGTKVLRTGQRDAG